MNRFDHVKYDEAAKQEQEAFKLLCEKLENRVDLLPNNRCKALAYTKLEEFYMWVGKGIRDMQIERERAFELPDDKLSRI